MDEKPWSRSGIVLADYAGHVLRPENYLVPNGMTRPDCPRCGAQALHDMTEDSRCCGECGARVHVWSFKLLPDGIHRCPDCGSLNYAWDYQSVERIGRHAVSMHGRGWCQDCEDWKEGHAES